MHSERSQEVGQKLSVRGKTSDRVEQNDLRCFAQIKRMVEKSG